MTRFIFVLLYVTVFSVSIFGQNLEADLRRSFRKFKVTKINNQEALKKARLGLPFKIQPQDKEFQFILRLNDIRAADYRSEYTDRNGRQSVPRGEIFTFKANIIGERKSAVALTVDGRTVEGFLATESESFFIEPAKKYSAHANDEDKVIYKTEDKVTRDDGICGLDEAFVAGKEFAGSQINSNTEFNPPSGRRVVEVATEADKEFVLDSRTGNGSPITANNHILSVLNQVDVAFRRDLNLSISVTYQIAWAPGSVDPYQGNEDYALLHAFRAYWNANFPYTNYRRDAAHLFTLKYTSYNGVAISIGNICDPPNAYSVTANPFPNKWVITAHELGHNLGASHPNQQNPVPPDCTFSIMNSLTQYGATGFCSFSIQEITNFVNTNGSCLHIENTPRSQAMFDFDSDGESDISVFRPSDTYWYVQQSTAGFNAVQFGVSTDKLAPADYDGDGKFDIAVFRSGSWYLLRSTDGFLSTNMGTTGDIPAPADFTGDGKAEIAVFRPSNGTWYTLDLTNNESASQFFGQNGDKPVVGNYDGDLRADYAVFRPSDATWYLLQSSQGSLAIPFGISTDKPIPADYNGDGKTDLAVYRDGIWYWRKSFYETVAYQFGLSTDTPAPADYDGDGIADYAIFRNGLWAWHNSSTNVDVYVNFGQSADIPVPSFKIIQ